MSDIDILKIWVKNKMFDYKLVVNDEGYKIYYDNNFICYSKNPKTICKAIKVLGGKHGIN